MGLESARELRDAVRAIRQDPNVRVLVLAGAGRAFCAGGDVPQFHPHLGDAPAFLDGLVGTVHEIINDLLVTCEPSAWKSTSSATSGKGLANSCP
jgi:2-(1,2-epoxy-1,2-dihydrophenyl)acetyl-CoA isomerase